MALLPYPFAGVKISARTSTSSGRAGERAAPARNVRPRSRLLPAGRPPSCAAKLQRPSRGLVGSPRRERGRDSQGPSLGSPGAHRARDPVRRGRCHRHVRRCWSWQPRAASTCRGSSRGPIRAPSWPEPGSTPSATSFGFCGSRYRPTAPESACAACCRSTRLTAWARRAASLQAQRPRAGEGGVNSASSWTTSVQASRLPGFYGRSTRPC